MLLCCMPNCPFTGHPNIVVYPFPKLPSMRQLWESFVASDFVADEKAGLCSGHFSNNDYVIEKKRVSLKRRAVPTIIHSEIVIPKHRAPPPTPASTGKKGPPRIEMHTVPGDSTDLYLYITSLLDKIQIMEGSLNEKEQMELELQEKDATIIQQQKQIQSMAKEIRQLSLANQKLMDELVEFKGENRKQSVRIKQKFARTVRLEMRNKEERSSTAPSQSNRMVLRRCDNCNQLFSKMRALKRHFYVSHSDDVDDDYDPSSLKFHKLSVTDVGEFKVISYDIQPKESAIDNSLVVMEDKDPLKF